ncbi:hypothetical protein [Curtobacterium sp. MCLR17_054]|uniref:hypothetical protein n=1 Tax=Curtobacterium sp. MCLR17_054 TaxID=2175632 RepID=UPI0011B63786|nr:hypothetical protein [Curtobacterium sp. MCLR17_054]WIE69700.1 hypothetical protein DEJ08_006955 [Curtobacterium sp. MCLR17_054]
MEEFLKSLAELIGKAGASFSLVAGVLLGLFANVLRDTLSDRRDRNKAESTRARAAEDLREQRAREAGQAALDVALSAYQHLLRSDELADQWKRREGVPEGGSIPPQAVRTRDLLGHEFEEAMAKLELQYAGQLNDEERRDLLERGTATALATVDWGYGTQTRTPSMRRDVVRRLAGVLSTFLAGSPVSASDRDAINALHKIWLPTEAEAVDENLAEVPLEQPKSWVGRRFLAWLGFRKRSA